MYNPRRHIYVFCCLILSVHSFSQLRYTLDPASVSNLPGGNPGNIIMNGAVLTTAQQLGIGGNFPNGMFSALDGLSYGNDKFTTFSQTNFFFSVDRNSIGLAGTDVNTMAQPGESAAGSIFAPNHNGGNNLSKSAVQLGLTTGFFGDDLRDFSMDTQVGNNIYFSIDQYSASNQFGNAALSRSILISTGNGTYNTFAGPQTMGLFGNLDDISSIILDDTNTPGTLNPGVDHALFTLSSQSTSGSAGNIYYTDFTGTFQLWAAGGQLGLASGDMIDGLAVPEPETIIPLLGATLLIINRIKRISLKGVK